MTFTFPVIAANIVANNGFTPCPHSSFETAEKILAFSSESVNGKSWSGPAFEVVIVKANGETFVSNNKTHERTARFSVES